MQKNASWSNDNSNLQKISVLLPVSVGPATDKATVAKIQKTPIFMIRSAMVTKTRRLQKSDIYQSKLKTKCHDIK